MVDFYKTDRDLVIGGAARVLIAPGTADLPTQISNIVGLTSPFAAVASTYDWEDIGSTQSDTVFQPSVNMNVWRSQQNGPIKRKPTDAMGKITIDMMETATRAAKLRLLQVTGAQSAASTAAGETRINGVLPRTIDSWHLAVLFRDDAEKFHALVLTNAMWDGAAIDINYSDSNPQVIKIGMEAYPDEDNVDATSNEPIMWYMLDQES